MLAENIRKNREEIGLTQAELAKITGLTRSAIGMYETGSREPKLETIRLLCKLFNVDMDSLANGAGENGEKPNLKAEKACEVTVAINSTDDLVVLEKICKFVLNGKVSKVTICKGVNANESNE